MQALLTLVGQYKGQPCIMDFKQTNKPKKLEYVQNYFLQLVAYAEAHNAIYGTNIREGHIFMCSRGDDGHGTWWRNISAI